MARNYLQYFGKIMPFTDRNGARHENAFWKLQDFRINTDRRELTLIFVAYESKEDFNAGSGLLVSVGGMREHTFTGEAYDRLILLYAQAVAGVALATWQIVGAIKDTPNAEGVFESFFANAGEILAPAELQGLFGQTSD